jgi:eukaryotic-like serine/threonine-protein kinase
MLEPRTEPLTADSAGTTSAAMCCPACEKDPRTGLLAECQACLFRAGLPLEEPRRGSSEHPSRVGSYVLTPLDEGSTGKVYIAQPDEETEPVALKLAKDEMLQSADTLAAFRSGIRIQKALGGHPNIVRTYDVGTDALGRPFFTMELVERGTLAARANRALYPKPTDVIELMAKIARAVHHAHQRRVLHCDLKPSNVLVRDNREPLLADFGLSSVLPGSSITAGATFRGGTPGWMSPEQAARNELTTASDVFALGILLYWLTSGRLPFGDGDDFAERVAHDDPLPLTGHVTERFSWEIERICRRAMEKKPEERYPSAAAFADELDHVLRGLPIEAESRRPFRKARKWIRRNKLVSLVIIELVFLLLYFPLMPLSVLGEVKDTIQKQNAFSATAQAGAVMNELRAAAARVMELARKPEVQRLVHHEDIYTPAPALAEGALGFDSASVFSADGTLRARSRPRDKTYKRLNYAFRDYFKGQHRMFEAGRSEAYVARAFKSTSGEGLMLGLAAPLIDAGGKYIGAVTLLVLARSTFGGVQMNCGGHGTCMTALLGPRDRDVPEQPLPERIAVLAAPGLSEGQHVLLDIPLSRMIADRLGCAPAPWNQFDRPGTGPMTLDAFVDPISGVSATAALAPVGKTGLVVTVATPQTAIDELTERMTHRIGALLWVPLALGLIVLGVLIAGPWPTARRER